MTTSTQVVVVGGGPAGLCAAATAAAAGARVTLVDEGTELGGQLLYKVQPLNAFPGQPALRPSELRDMLLNNATVAGVDLRRRALAAGIYANGEVMIVEQDQAWSIIPDALVLATGSTDLPFPFAGGTLPGVWSCRALQMLINRWGVRPGKRFGVIGAGAEAEELAIDILLANGEVAWGGLAPAQLLRAVGNEGVNGLQVGPEDHAVDIVAIAVGRQADVELAAMAGCPIGFAASLGGLAPKLDANLQMPGTKTFVCGDCAGTGSVAAVIAEGKMAGFAAAASLGLGGEADLAAVRSAGGEELLWRAAARDALVVAHQQPYH